MRAPMRAQKPKKSAPRKGKSTTGRDNMVSETGRKDYYVSDALEITPHPNQRLVSTLRQPVMDRKFKYSILESQLTASGLTSTTPLSLVSINQGTTDITRTGDRIRAKRIWLQARIQGGTTQASAVTTRLIVVFWNVPGVGAVNAPVASQVLQGSANYLPFAAYSRDYGDQYQIVHDSVHSIQPNSATTESALIHLDRALTVDLEFGAGATTPMVNGLYLFLVSESGGVTTAQPNILFQSTLWYEDLDA